MVLILFEIAFPDLDIHFLYDSIRGYIFISPKLLVLNNSYIDSNSRFNLYLLTS